MEGLAESASSSWFVDWWRKTIAEINYDGDVMSQHIAILIFSVMLQGTVQSNGSFVFTTIFH
jgi:hypothetical protein